MNVGYRTKKCTHDPTYNALRDATEVCLRVDVYRLTNRLDGREREALESNKYVGSAVSRIIHQGLGGND